MTYAHKCRNMARHVMLIRKLDMPMPSLRSYNHPARVACNTNIIAQTLAKQHLTDIGHHNATESNQAEWVARYNAALISTWGLRGVFHATSDASRNGAPAEDTSVFIGWEPESNVGGYLALQVLRTILV